MVGLVAVMLVGAVDDAAACRPTARLACFPSPDGDRASLEHECSDCALMVSSPASSKSIGVLRDSKLPQRSGLNAMVKQAANNATAKHTARTLSPQGYVIVKIVIKHRGRMSHPSAVGRLRVFTDVSDETDTNDTTFEFQHACACPLSLMEVGETLSTKVCSRLAPCSAG